MTEGSERRIRVPMGEAAEALEFEMLPEDRSYLLEVEDLDEDEGERGPYWNAQLRVVDDPEYDGRVFFDVWPIPREENLAQPGKVRKKELRRSFRLWAFLEAAGYKWGELGFAQHDLLGLRARATLKVETYQGRSRQRPDNYLAA